MFRDYDVDKDGTAALRIWREVGWPDDEKKEDALARFIACSRARVAGVNGEAECLVNTAPATLRYIDQDMAFSGTMGVTTSRVARKQGLASRLAASTLAQDIVEGGIGRRLGDIRAEFLSRPRSADLCGDVTWEMA